MIKEISKWKDAEEIMKSIWDSHWATQESEFRLLISQPLFRGQSNSDWQLNTTLDRTMKGQDISVEDYHFILRRILNEVSSRSDKEWEIEDYANFPFFGNHLTHIPPKTYAFMVHLRHHGFPSPLLDWSQSFYVASFFAFKDIPIGAQTVSIFIYKQNLGDGTMTEIGEPYLTVMGPNVHTHMRHYKQQCEYSLCLQFTNNSFAYRQHQLVFDQGVEGQDWLMELRIPVTERKEAMRRLLSMNISSMSLFEDEDGFIQGLGEKVFL